MGKVHSRLEKSLKVREFTVKNLTLLKVFEKSLNFNLLIIVVSVSKQNASAFIILVQVLCVAEVDAMQSYCSTRHF